MPILLAFDPGYATGVFQGWYDDENALTRQASFVIPGGTEGFAEWAWKELPGRADYEYVSEKFDLNANNEFKADLTPVQIEGILIAFTRKITWQPRGEKGKAGVMDAILQKHDLWVTGRDVNWEDGRDANDATIHALAYMKKKRHLPTLQKYFRD